MEKIIIFGGSFDPLHNGHLRIARSASLLLNADVVFVPAKEPRWKKTEASSQDRLAMLRLGLLEDGSGAFSIDECELQREGDVTYSIDTVRYFLAKYPGRRLCLLIGADEVGKFPKWKDPDMIASMTQIVFASRPDTRVDQEIVKKYHMERLDYGESGPVSSNAVRSLRSIDIPSKVIDYIESHGLYYIHKIKPYLSEKRLAHSISVAHLAYAIAKKNSVLQADDAYIAGMLHDVGKSMEEDKARKIVAENYPEYAKYPAWSLHQFVGAYLAQKEFGIVDPAVIDAIEFHCTGKPHMPPLTKIVYSADKIEPTRGYNSKKLIDACLKNYYVGFLEVLKANEKYLKKLGQVESTPLSDSCSAIYLGGE